MAWETIPTTGVETIYIDIPEFATPTEPINIPSSWLPHSCHAELCPVCKGTGKVPHGFYWGSGWVSDATPEVCRSCGGKGYIII